jgi:hypothetical protein
VPHTPSSFVLGQSVEPEKMVEKVRRCYLARHGRSDGCLGAGRQAGLAGRRCLLRGAAAYAGCLL